MTFNQFLKTDKLTDAQRANFLNNTIQAILDANWPGVKAERLSAEHIEEMVLYISENYQFRFINSGIMNSVVAEPK